jgi:hypothetical protein
VSLIIVLLGPGTRYSFYFPVNPVLNNFFEKSGFHPFFFKLLQLVPCNYVLDRLVSVFNCLFSFSWFIFLCCDWLGCYLGWCAFSVPGLEIQISTSKFTSSMPDQLFTYYIETPLMITSINSGSWGWVMVIMLHIEFWEIGKGGTKSGRGKRDMWVGEEEWGLLALWPLCVWVYWCCSGGCLSQGL